MLRCNCRGGCSGCYNLPKRISITYRFGGLFQPFKPWVLIVFWKTDAKSKGGSVVKRGVFYKSLALALAPVGRGGSFGVGCTAAKRH